VLYLPTVPSRIDSFDCIPEKRPVNAVDQFAPLDALAVNNLKFYFNVSPLNTRTQAKFIAIRFLSTNANRNPIVNKYPLGVYFAQVQQDDGGLFFEIPAGLFITTTTSNTSGSFVLDSSSRIVKRIKDSTTSTVLYSDLTEASGINEFYRSQIKVLDGTASIISNSWVFTPTGTSSITVTIDNLNPISNQYISDWSESTLMKPIFIGDLESSSFGVAGFTSREITGELFAENLANSEFFNFQFRYFDTDEPLQYFQFKIYDSNKQLYEDSGQLEVDRFSGVQYLDPTTTKSLLWSNTKGFSNGENYYITLSFKTTTGFFYTYQYEFLSSYSIVPLGLGFRASSDEDNGRIEFEIFGRQVNFINNNGISGYEFVNSDDVVTGSDELKQNALEVTDGLMSNKQPLIFNTNYNGWSLQGIFAKIQSKTNGPLDYSTLEEDFMFKLQDASENPQFSYYLIPITHTQMKDPSYSNINWTDRIFNEFNLVKVVNNTEAGPPGQPSQLNNGFRRSTSSIVQSKIFSTYKAYMTPGDISKSETVINGDLFYPEDDLYPDENLYPQGFSDIPILGNYALINGASDNSLYSSPEDISNKYYLFLGESNGALFLYAKHLNPDSSLIVEEIGDVNISNPEITEINTDILYRGMAVEGPGIDEDTFVVSVKTSSLIISKNPISNHNGQTYSFFSNVDRLNSREA
jgi:hypothetical protein